MKKVTGKHDSNQPATQRDIGELAEIMTDGITYLSKGQERLEGRMDGLEGRMDGLEGRMSGLEGKMDKMEQKLEKVEVQVSDTNRRLRDVEFDTPTRKDFQKLKQRVDRYIPATA